MRSFILQAFFVYCLLSSVAAFATPTPFTAVIRDDDNNVRAYGGSNYAKADILAVVNKGDQVKVLRQDGRWSEIVMANGQRGWVNSACLVPASESPTSSAAVAAAASSGANGTGGSCLRGNCQSGVGLFEYADKSRYEGSFLNGMRQGMGTLTRKNGTTLTGPFTNDKMNGQFKVKYDKGNTYEGGMRDDQFFGRGIYTWTNGKRYEGEVSNNEANGTGVMIFADGSKYEGEFLHWALNGKGKMTDASGKVKQGIWSDGALIQNGIAGEKPQGSAAQQANNQGNTSIYNDKLATSSLPGTHSSQDDKKSNILNNNEENQNISLVDKTLQYISDMFHSDINQLPQFKPFVACGLNSTIISTAPGEIWVTGEEMKKWLGVIDCSDMYLPATFSTPKKYVSWAASRTNDVSKFMLALADDGSVDYYSRFNNEKSQSALQTQVPGIKTAVAVAAGDATGLILTTKGRVLSVKAKGDRRQLLLSISDN